MSDDSFQTIIDTMPLVNHETIPQRITRLRRERIEKWDHRFLGMVDLVGSWSKDPSTKVGAVITRPDNTVASIGYNGFPRGMSDAANLYAEREVKYSRIVHAEMNAILNSHGGITSNLGSTLYVPMLCCDRCAVHVIQSGIKRVVCREPSADMSSRWGEAFEKTRAMFREAKVEVVEYPLEVPVETTLTAAEDDFSGLTMRFTFPSVDGKKIGEAVLRVDDMVLSLSRNGPKLGTDDERLAFLEKLSRRALTLATTGAGV